MTHTGRLAATASFPARRDKRLSRSALLSRWLLCSALFLRGESFVLATSRSGRWTGARDTSAIGASHEMLQSNSVRPDKELKLRKVGSTLRSSANNSENEVESEMLVDEDEDDDEASKRQIVVTSDIELPFSVDVAYDAFSNLPRQPSWSPLLRKVIYLNNKEDGGLRKSKWTMKYLGLPISWTAVTTMDDRPRVLCWESVTGLRNNGRVEFEELADPDGSNIRTHMKLTMTFQAPRVVVRLFQKDHSRIQRMVEMRMLRTTLLQFRKIVQENDAGNKRKEDDYDSKKLSNVDMEVQESKN